MSQVQLANAADVGLSTVQRAERSDRTLGIGAAVRIANALGLETDRIYDDGSGGSNTRVNSEVIDRIADLQEHLESVERKIERLIRECHGSHINERHHHTESDN
jgi:transcriptional regulator with XRE-family HTH domain